MSSPNPILSVIVPYHNRPKEILELLATMPDDPGIEVILVNDHSTEAGPTECGLALTQVRWLSNGSDQRYAGAARNLGLRSARGQFVMFCDSDDLVVPDVILAAIGHIRTASADVCFLYSSSFLDGGGRGSRHIGYNWLVYETERTGSTRHLIQFEPPWAKLIRRDFIERHGLEFESVRYSNDVMFSARLIAAGPRVTVFPKVGYLIRQGNPSLTTEVSVASIVARIEVLKRYNRFLRQTGHGVFAMPIIGQLHKIFRKDLRVTAGIILSALRDGDPVFVTRFSLMKRFRRGLCRRLDLFPV